MPLEHFATYAFPSYLATSIWNTFDIPLEYLKHLKHTLATYVWNRWNILNKRLQHASENWQHASGTLCNICIPDLLCNIHMKHFQHTFGISETLKAYACNIRLKQMKHFEQTLATCLWKLATCLWNTLQGYAFSIYFATSIWNTSNIPLEYLKHLKHTLATYQAWHSNGRQPPCQAHWGTR
jgi:hypothetical protein